MTTAVSLCVSWVLEPVQKIALCLEFAFGVVVPALSEAAASAESSASAWWRSHRAAAVGTHAVVVDRLAFLAFAEGFEGVGGGEEDVAAEGVVPRLRGGLAGGAERDGFALSEDVVGFDADGGVFAAQELVFERGVPYPLCVVEALVVAFGGAVAQVGVEGEVQQAQCAVERAAVVVDGAVVLCADGVFHYLRAVVGADVQFGDVVAEGDARGDVEVERRVGVEHVVVDVVEYLAGFGEVGGGDVGVSGVVAGRFGEAEA